jgi:molybdopterin-guanine dinucleotide biosynthesis protein A
MGQDKATLEFDGQPLWERQLELLRVLGPEKMFVSARTNPAWLRSDVELLLDDPPSRGPLSGVAKALTAMRSTHLVVLAVDMPFMMASEFDRLLDLVTEDCGIVPVVAGHAEPLAAIYPAEAADDFGAALAGRDFSLQTVIRNLAASGKVKLWPVAEEDAKLYRSVNEPGDAKL